MLSVMCSELRMVFMRFRLNIKQKDVTIDRRFGRVGFDGPHHIYIYIYTQKTLAGSYDQILLLSGESHLSKFPR